MTIRKIDDGEGWRKSPICYDREHSVPTMISLPPSTYEHECPSCHKRTVFRVSGGAAGERRTEREGAFGREGGACPFLAALEKGS